MKRIALFLLILSITGETCGQVIISEIMGDPSPSAGLPEMEYIEIHNISDRIIDLTGWEILDRTTKGKIMGGRLLPDSFALLVPSRYPAAVSQETIVSPWPTLNNSGDLVILSDPQGNISDSLEYSSNWYSTSAKAQGGWSLERMDLFRACVTSLSWAESVHKEGGTPGSINSVSGNQDTDGPQITEVLAQGNTQLRVLFNEPVMIGKMDFSSFETGGKFKLADWKSGERSDTLHLRTVDEMKEGTRYELTIKEIEDCKGNRSITTKEFYLAGTLEQEDVRISEILFDPVPGGSDFIELINRGKSYVNLKGLLLNYWQMGDEDPSRRYHVTSDVFLLPGEFLLMAEDPEHFRQTIADPAAAILEEKLFNITNEGGILTLSYNGNLLDSVHADPSFHHDLLQNPEGFSLERTNYSLPGWETIAWMSSSDGATPGIRNSQQVSVTEDKQGIRVFPEIIRPGSLQDGSARISIQTGQPGVIGKVVIYSLDGHRVATLLDNTLLPVSGNLRWDGMADDGRRVSNGYYIIHFLLTGPNGFRKSWKRRVVVAP